MNNREKLLMACKLINDVRSTLDARSDSCPCCGLSVKANWAEEKLNERLKGMTQRLPEIVETHEFRVAMEKGTSGHKSTEEGT